MAEVTRRFLAASGPVTREDFARWWGIPSPAKGRRLLERLGDEVARVEVEARAAYALAADLPGLAKAGRGRNKAGARSATVRLLPAFDQYVITATRQAEHLMPGPFKARVYRPQGWLSPVLLVGGRMEGLAPGGQGPAPGGHHRALRRAAPRPGPARRRGRGRAPGRLHRGELELRWAEV